MRRVLTFILEVGFLAAWALRLGVAEVVPVMAVAGLAAAWARRRGAWALLVWVVLVVAGAFVAGPWGVLFSVVALWRGASPIDPEHPAVYQRIAIAIGGAAILAVNAPAYTWVVPVVLGVGLVTALATTVEPDVALGTHVRLAGWLAAAGILVGLVVLGLAAWAPWQYLGGLVRALLFGIGHLIPSFGVHAHVPKPSSPVHPHHNRHPQRRPGKPRSPLPLLIFAGLVLLTGAYFAVRALARVGWPELERTDNVDREGLEIDPRAAAAGGRTVLTRRVVQRHMRLLARTQHRPETGETVREWLGRLYGDTAADVVPRLVELYEAVRYGGVADDATRARTAQRLWPPASGESNDRREDPPR